MLLTQPSAPQDVKTNNLYLLLMVPSVFGLYCQGNKSKEQHVSERAHSPPREKDIISKYQEKGIQLCYVCVILPARDGATAHLGPGRGPASAWDEVNGPLGEAGQGVCLRCGLPGKELLALDGAPE